MEGRLGIGMCPNNLVPTIWKLFHVLAQFLFTIRETELDYYHQKAGVLVTSGDLRNLRLKTFINFKEILGILGFDGEYLVKHPKAKF